MASNPQLMEQMMQNNPMFAGNPRSAEMVSTHSNAVYISDDLNALCVLQARQASQMVSF